jgi:hypothetical protein
MSLKHPAVPGPDHTYRVWDSAADRRGAGVPDWWNGSTTPLVYVGLGTVAAQPGLFPDLDRGSGIGPGIGLPLGQLHGSYTRRLGHPAC